MSKTTTVRAKVLRNFKDDGTQRRFTADQVVPFEEGVFANYRAAGLVEAAPDEGAAEPATTGEPAAKSSRSRN